jgi:predicted outer membrane repeat protein
LLTSGELLVNKSVSILGPGAANLAVNGNHSNRVFHVTAGTTVTIAGLTITNGFAIGASPNWPFGGGIWNEYGTLTVSNSLFAGNSSSNYGGAIYNDGFSGWP